jgi:hypothetical protein
MTLTAWDLIGFDGFDETHWPDDGEHQPAWVRVKGGRALYEAVMYLDSTPGTQVKLARLDTAPTGGLREVSRYVDPDTLLELVEEGAS